ncbi:MAG: hypothetical protein JXA87_13120 [Thermoleophilia bacterium]|nr:hypothetical protein [Thermoleophilia bacterium]
MAAPRTQAKKEADRLQVSRLYLENRPIGEIARAVGINRLTVSSDIKAVREEWARSRVGNFSAWVAQELARIDLVELRAWECFHRSVGEHRKDKSRRLEGVNGSSSLEETVTEELVGDGRFLDLALRCVAERARILGLYAPTKSEGRFEHEHHHTVQSEFDREFARLLERLEPRGEGPGPGAGEKLPRGFEEPS